MPSTLYHSTPVTPAEEPKELVESRRESLDEPDERHREPSTEEPPASPSSASQALNQPPQTPLKDRDSVGRLTGNPTLSTDSPTAHTTTLRESTPPRLSQVVEFNSVAQTTLTAAAELIAGNVNRPDDAPSLSKMTGAGSPVNQPIATGYDGTGIDANPYASGSTSNVTNPNPVRTHPNTATTSGTSGGVVNTVHYHPDRSQTPLSSGPLSPERRQSGPGPATYDPIRGDLPGQVYLPGGSGNGGGDPIGMPSQLGSIRRTSVPRPRPAFNPTDGTLVGNGNGLGYGPGPGSRRASRMMSGHDWVPDIVEEPLPPREKTVEDRLRPTIEAATVERDKYQKRARLQGLLINGAIGLQIAVGAITTGVAAAGTHIGAAVASLGAISTILASYLAKVRGSGEPEFSTIHARELNTFLRDIEGFIMDHGHKIGTEQDDKILMYRARFESIIKTDGEDSGGATGYSQRPISTPHPSYPPHPIPHPPHVYVTGVPGVMDEKQMWRNEKAISGMV